MKKIIFKTLKITGIVVGVLLILLISLPFMFKGKIMEVAKEQLNKNLRAKVDFADIDISVFRNFPGISVELIDLSVVGVDPFEGDTLISAKSTYLSMDLFTLFKDTMAIDGIILDNPRLNIIYLEDGSANYDITIPAEEQEEPEEESGAFAMEFDHFELINAYISYDDRDMGMSFLLKGFDFNLKGDMTADETNLDIDMKLGYIDYEMDGVKFLKQATLSYQGTINADFANWKYSFEKNEIVLNEIPLSFDGYIDVSDTTKMSIDMNFAAAKSDFKSFLSLIPAIYLQDFGSLKTAGKFGFEGFVKGDMHYYEDIIPTFDVKLMVENGMFSYPDLPKSVDNINIDIHAFNPDGLMDNTGVDVNKFHIEMAGNPIDLFLKLRTPISDPQINARLDAKMDLGSLASVYPLEGMNMSGMLDANVQVMGKMSSLENERYEEFQAEGKIDLTAFDLKSPDMPAGGVYIDKTVFLFSPQALELAQLDMKIGKSDLSVAGKLQNYLAYLLRNETIVGNIQLNSKLMDLNELMGQGESTEAETATEEESAPMSVVEIPANIDFSLETNISTIQYGPMAITDFQGLVVIRDQKLDLSKVRMDMLGGSLSMSGYYDAKDLQKPAVDFMLDMRNFDITKSFETFDILKTIAPIAENAAGQISLRIDMNSLLDQEMSPVLNTLNAVGMFSSRKLSIQGSDFLANLAEKTHNDNYKSLSFNNLKVNFKIEDGTLTVEPFTTKFGNSDVIFGGKQIIDGQMEYNMDMAIPSKELGAAANKLLSGLTGGQDVVGEEIMLNVMITGTPDNPQLKIASSTTDDLKNQLEDRAKEELDKAKEKAQEEIDKAKQQAEEEAEKLRKKAEEEKRKLQEEAERKKKEAERKAKEEADKKKKELEEKAKEKINDIF